MARAFDKSCVPSVPAIGDYSFVDNCDFPPALPPLVTPTDPPVPIPPVDQGCFPIEISAAFHGPSDPETPSTGSLGVSVDYKKGDFCEPEITLDIFVPCFVTFTSTFVDVKFDPNLTDAQGTMVPLDDGSCNLGLSLSLGLPCPTDLFGGTGTARFNPNLPAGRGSTTVTAAPAGTDCDFSLNIDVDLPCPDPTIIRLFARTAPDNCIPLNRLPFFRLINSSSSNENTCSKTFDFELVIPCPIEFRGSQRPAIIPQRGFGAPTIFIDIERSSSRCDRDCNPTLIAELVMPCPTGVEIGSQRVEFSGDLWAKQPTLNFYLTYDSYGPGVNLDCNPKLNLEMYLPCPIDLNAESTVAAGTLDYSFFANSTPINRAWAYGQPGGKLKVLKGLGDCLPKLELSLNLPCPVGGLYEEVPNQAPSDLREYLEWFGKQNIRQSLVQSLLVQYGLDATNHPNYLKVPAGEVLINRNLNTFTNDTTLQAAAGFAAGAFTHMETDDNCNLNIGLSLYIPCGKRSPAVKFHHISDFPRFDAPELPGYSASVEQDWLTGPGGTDDCAFDEVLHLFLNPSAGCLACTERVLVTGSTDTLLIGEVLDFNLAPTGQSVSMSTYRYPPTDILDSCLPRISANAGGDGDIVPAYKFTSPDGSQEVWYCALTFIGTCLPSVG